MHLVRIEDSLGVNAITYAFEERHNFKLRERTANDPRIA